ncbi:hypothetical protein KCP71_17590 [Salmonella enterica subsp. enterica]|nr:hypothetical protein KCP71_17590 [Salmonella enterica subsp. enterica]
MASLRIQRFVCWWVMMSMSLVSFCNRSPQQYLAGPLATHCHPLKSGALKQSGECSAPTVAACAGSFRLGYQRYDDDREK